MKPIHIRMQELQKEIQDLAALKEEAKSEYIEADELQLYYRSKSEAAYERMRNRQDEIEYRQAEIAELEESIKNERAIA